MLCIKYDEHDDLVNIAKDGDLIPTCHKSGIDMPYLALPVPSSLPMSGESLSVLPPESDVR